MTDEWTKGPGLGSKIIESDLYRRKKDLVYDPEAMKGLPVGVQVIGKSWEDEKVVAMMKVVDDALGPRAGLGRPPGKRIESRSRPLLCHTFRFVFFVIGPGISTLLDGPWRYPTSGGKVAKYMDKSLSIWIRLDKRTPFTLRRGVTG